MNILHREDSVEFHWKLNISTKDAETVTAATILTLYIILKCVLGILWCSHNLLETITRSWGFISQVRNYRTWFTSTNIFHIICFLCIPLISFFQLLISSSLIFFECIFHHPNVHLWYQLPPKDRWFYSLTVERS